MVGVIVIPAKMTERPLKWLRGILVIAVASPFMQRTISQDVAPSCVRLHQRLQFVSLCFEWPTAGRLGRQSLNRPVYLHYSRQNF
jgi:hypothetical protein